LGGASHLCFRFAARSRVIRPQGQRSVENFGPPDRFFTIEEQRAAHADLRAASLAVRMTAI